VSGSFDVQVTTTTFAFPENLPQGEYWFCVEAKDRAGNWSGFLGEKRRFIVNVSLTPANNAVVVLPSAIATTNLTFRWSAVTEAAYNITIASDPGFSSLIVNNVPVTGTSYTLPGQSSGTYYWQVSVNSTTVPVPLAHHVTVSPPLPGMPLAPFTPANNAFTSDTTPTLTWTAPTMNPLNVAGYRVELSTSSVFATQIAGSPFDAGASTTGGCGHTTRWE
jgi:hypothetical protein